MKKKIDYISIVLHLTGLAMIIMGCWLFMNHNKVGGIFFSIAGIMYVIWVNHITELGHKFTLYLTYNYWSIYSGNKEEEIKIEWDERKVHKN